MVLAQNRFLDQKNGIGFPKIHPHRLLQRHLHTHVYCSTIHNSQVRENSQDAPPLTNGSRKCGIYTQWNFMQP